MVRPCGRVCSFTRFSFFRAVSVVGMVTDNGAILVSDAVLNSDAVIISYKGACL